MEHAIGVLYKHVFRCFTLNAGSSCNISTTLFSVFDKILSLLDNIFPRKANFKLVRGRGGNCLGNPEAARRMAGTFG